MRLMNSWTEALHLLRLYGARSRDMATWEVTQPAAGRLSVTQLVNKPHQESPIAPLEGPFWSGMNEWRETQHAMAEDGW